MYQIFIAGISANCNRDEILSILRSYGRFSVDVYCQDEHFYAFVKFERNEAAINAFENHAMSTNFFFTYTRSFATLLAHTHQSRVQPNLPACQLQNYNHAVAIPSPFNGFVKKKPLLFFTNLDYKIRNLTPLIEVFSRYGYVNRIQLIQDSDGIHHKGQGLVFFNNCFIDPELIRRFSDNTIINGRKLVVELSNAYKRYLENR